jgi:hypothetical protein
MLVGFYEKFEEIQHLRCQTGNCDEIVAEIGERIRQSSLKRIKKL